MFGMQRGMRYIPLIDPGISGGEGKGNENIFS